MNFRATLTQALILEGVDVLALKLALLLDLLTGQPANRAQRKCRAVKPAN